MKKLFTTLFIVFGFSLFGQQAYLDDWNADGVMEYVKYSDDGKKIEEGYVIDGKYHGKWTSYYTDGTIRVIARFKNGIKHGTWSFYNENGELTHEVVYENNRKVSALVTRYFQ